jgi:hypothetical protein
LTDKNRGSSSAVHSAVPFRGPFLQFRGPHLQASFRNTIFPGSAVQFRGPVPRSSSAVQFRGPVPRSSSAVQFRGTVPRSSSAVQFRGPVPRSSFAVPLWGHICNIIRLVYSGINQFGILFSLLTMWLSMYNYYIPLNTSPPIQLARILLSRVEPNRKIDTDILFVLERL